jgi:NAD(P)-dependent dehydrogenase (short-subunit alcohol dehydrogenase family)
MKLKNANVLITGGASGIGKIMGRMALEKGAKTFIIWDINITNIEATRNELSKFGRVKGYVVDVSNPEMVELAYRKTVSDCGYIDVLINCAGIITSNKTFDQVSTDETMTVSFSFLIRKHMNYLYLTALLFQFIQFCLEEYLFFSSGTVKKY